MKGLFMIIVELFQPPDGGPYTKFFMGQMIPGVISLYVLFALLIGETVIPVKGFPKVPGLPGALVALIYLGVAGLFYFHWNWGLSHERWHLCVRAKWGAFALITLSLLGFIAYYLYHS